MAAHVASPHQTGVYVVGALFGSILGCTFIWEAFARVGVPLGWRIAQFGCAVLFCFGTLQCAKRLFRPARAQTRSGSLSAAACTRLRTAAKSTVYACGAASLTAASLKLFGAGDERNLASDLTLLAMALLFVGHCLTDICGERLFPFSGSGRATRKLAAVGERRPDSRQ